jgi:hypothetical protein
MRLFNPGMKLFLVERTDNPGLDMFDAMVVAARSPIDAMRMHPREGGGWWTEDMSSEEIWDDDKGDVWVYWSRDTEHYPEDLKVTEIGRFRFDVPTVILASFNAS